MGYHAIPVETPLRDYEPPELQIECVRCKRNATVKVQAMAKKFGMGIPIGDLVRQVAGSGKRPCGLAGTGQCAARAWEPPVWHWADLERAWRGGWIARLHCRRNRAGLKATTPCPEMVIVDVETLVATLGYEFKLERLPNAMPEVSLRTRRCGVDRAGSVAGTVRPGGGRGAAAVEADAGAEGIASAEGGRRRSWKIDYWCEKPRPRPPDHVHEARPLHHRDRRID